MNEPQSNTGWGVERFTYTLEQLKWIARMLQLNGHQVWKVLDLMSWPISGFPIEPERVASFRDAAAWSHMIQRVESVLMGEAEFHDEWCEEIRNVTK